MLPSLRDTVISLHQWSSGKPVVTHSALRRHQRSDVHTLTCWNTITSHRDLTRRAYTATLDGTSNNSSPRADQDAKRRAGESLRSAM